MMSDSRPGPTAKRQATRRTSSSADGSGSSEVRESRLGAPNNTPRTEMLARDTHDQRQGFSILVQRLLVDDNTTSAGRIDPLLDLAVITLEAIQPVQHDVRGLLGAAQADLRSHTAR